MMSLLSLQRLGLCAVLGLLIAPFLKGSLGIHPCLALLEGTKLKEISNCLSWKNNSMSRDVTRVYICTLPEPLPYR